MTIRAIFLAAGFATRLYPLTRNRAKPLLEVGGQTMLTRILRQVERCDAVSDGVIVANARFASDFRTWSQAETSAFPLLVVNDGATENEDRLGAIRDLALALERAPREPEADAYLVLACDNLVELDLQPMVERFRTTGSTQLLVREVPEPVPSARYSEVRLDGDRVTSFREKPLDPQSNLSAIAVYLLPNDLPELLLDYFAGGGEPDAPGHFLAWLHARRPLQAQRLTGPWWDIGSAEDLEQANRLFSQPPHSD